MNIILYPDCKINVGLRITEKREDGFHNLETLFVHHRLNDILEIIESDSLGISYYGRPFPMQGEDLCIKAYRLMKADYDLPPVHFHLYKQIPVGAGLGGGSSDAVAALKGLASLFSLKVPENRMLDYASRLGSDCPFFLYDRPMYGEGRGEILTPIEGLDLGRIETFTPDISISTREAYSGVIPYKNGERLLDLLKLPVTQWKDRVVNDFEASLFPRYPVLKEIKEDFYKKGAVYASMSGSGPTVYALFKD